MSDLEGQQPPEETELDTNPPGDTDDAAELASLAIDDGKGNKVVPLSALIGTKKEARALAKRIKELEPVASEAAGIKERLDRAQPIIDAVLNNPKLKAEAMRVAQGTHKTGEAVDQPDDAEAKDVAEDLGLYLADGVTPDVARAQRVLARLDGRGKRHTEEVMRPLAGSVLGSRADQNIRQAIAATDKDGVPYATEESIKAVAAQLPPHLLASEEVINLLLRTAIGEDRLNGRTPKAPEEPLYLSHAGAGRGSRFDAVTNEDRAFLKRTGMNEKDYVDINTRAAQAGKRGLALE